MGITPAAQGEMIFVDIDSSQVTSNPGGTGSILSPFGTVVTWTLQDGLDLTIAFTEGESINSFGHTFSSVGGTYNSVGNLNPYPLAAPSAAHHTFTVFTSFLAADLTTVVATRSDNFRLDMDSNELVVASSASTLGYYPLTFSGLRVIAPVVPEPGLATPLSNVKVGSTEGVTVAAVPEPNAFVFLGLASAGSLIGTLLTRRNAPELRGNR